VDKAKYVLQHINKYGNDNQMLKLAININN